ncbi:hypothetical protein HYH03_012572 [Edaphochlamys debaryana]|uniref:Uncharacterized protein n=1 Tax=Edaphochlamys debaryana TaxID=47281 RepID=A0A836BVE1_9CHLO|nr:hypothetical protein HYH03_012572 [Edaphochlamys debaryana]|eukprot:KAG2488953.1 hypothetical protein HYH03_012572 [Edaphochlamys debaryana]
MLGKLRRTFSGKRRPSQDTSEPGGLDSEEAGTTAQPVVVRPKAKPPVAASPEGSILGSAAAATALASSSISRDDAPTGTYRRSSEAGPAGPVTGRRNSADSAPFEPSRGVFAPHPPAAAAASPSRPAWNMGEDAAPARPAPRPSYGAGSPPLAPSPIKSSGFLASLSSLNHREKERDGGGILGQQSKSVGGGETHKAEKDKEKDKDRDDHHHHGGAGKKLASLFRSASKRHSKAEKGSAAAGTSEGEVVDGGKPARPADGEDDVVTFAGAFQGGEDDSEEEGVGMGRSSAPARRRAGAADGDSSEPVLIEPSGAGGGRSLMATAPSFGRR